MQVVLVMFREDGQRRSFSVVRDMTVIGRREDCDLRIPLHDVSRKHCRLIRDGEALRVEDLGSSNGTFRNGTRVQQSELSAGDTLQVGPVVFVLQVDGFPADEDLQPNVAGGTGAAPAEPVGGTAATPFDPMEALNAADGSGFEFHLEEDEAAAAAGGAEGDAIDDAIDMGEGAEPAPAQTAEAEFNFDEEPAEAEEAPVELEEASIEAEEAPVKLEEAPAAAEEAPVELEETPIELEELEEAPVDPESSEHDKKA